MCSDCAPPTEEPCITRREVLAAGLLAATSRPFAAPTLPKRPVTTLVNPVGVRGSSTTTQTATGDLAERARSYGLTIRPREEWAQGSLPHRTLPAETPKFLLVHHTASTNSYRDDAVAGQIRGFHRFHTGPDKGWPDVAYNFFVDRFGGVWEARAGSLRGPVAGDATGGNQGSSVLCCLIGDFNAAPPPSPALLAMTRLLAVLADRYGIDTSPDTEVEFISRGSNRWKKGSTVRTRTIAGHRDMSQTTCPGDAMYRIVTTTLARNVTALRTSVGPPRPSASP